MIDQMSDDSWLKNKNCTIVLNQLDFLMADADTNIYRLSRGLNITNKNKLLLLLMLFVIICLIL